MNTTKTEIKGVKAVEELVLDSNCMIPHFDYNDKTDSWDGFIFVYSDHSCKKKDLLGRVPVQIKASFVKDFSGEKKSKAFDISDIINYKNDGGVILFIVQIQNRSKKIYYNSLLPLDLKQLLKGTKKKQKKRSIQLDHIDSDDSLKMEFICRNFLIHRKKQYSLPLKGFTRKDVKEIMIQGVIPSSKKVDNSFLFDNHYMYGKTSLESPIYDLVAKVNLKELNQTINNPILINNKKYYDKCKIVETKNEKQIIFGSSVIFVIQDCNVTLKYNLIGDLEQKIHDLEFILDFVKTGSIISQGKTLLKINKSTKKDMKLNQIEEYFNYYSKILALLNIYDIDHKDVKFEEFTEQDKYTLETLINVMVLNKPYPDQKIKPGFCYFKIANLKLLSIAYETKNSEIKVQSINNIEKGFIRSIPKQGNSDNESDSKTNLSIYFLIDENGFNEYSNIKLDKVYQDISSFEHSPKFDEEVDLLALKYIKIFDNTNSKEYLNHASKLFEWLKVSNYNKDILVLNNLQIKKRIRNLNKDDLKVLENLKRKYIEDPFILCGIFILLENFESFTRSFDKLSKEEKENFKGFPIYSLLRIEKKY